MIALLTLKMLINCARVQNKFFYRTNYVIICIFCVRKDKRIGENLIEDLYEFVKSIYSILQPIMIIDWTAKMKKEWESVVEKI